jgi:hypothetical protein
MFEIVSDAGGEWLPPYRCRNWRCGGPPLCKPLHESDSLFDVEDFSGSHCRCRLQFTLILVLALPLVNQEFFCDVCAVELVLAVARLRSPNVS